MRAARILVIDDEEVIHWSIKETLRTAGHEIFTAETAAEGLSLFREVLPDLVFLDVRLPDSDGLTVLRKIKAEGERDAAVIIMTAFAEIRTAVEAMRMGAYDYLRKPFEFEELNALVARTLETTDLRREVVEIRQARKRTYGPENIVGSSAKMQQVLATLDKVAVSNAATVLVRGENGTGKELIARALHYGSRRADGPLVEIASTSMPEQLLESELFGYERGAFTDAKAAKRGLLELANEGTLFLDEIGDMPLASQAKLLRVIETRRFKRLGGTTDHQLDIRIVAATNRDLELAVREGKFREDLFYRLNVIPITVPPLRERREDIPLLIRHYIEKYNVEFRSNFRGISEEALQLLHEYSWPGNVRELRNLVERVMILERGEMILPEHLPPEIADPKPVLALVLQEENPRGPSLEEVEKNMVERALEMAGGNQTRAAQLLSIGRNALRYKMRKFGLSD